MTSPPEEPLDPSPESLFIRWLDLHESGEPVDLDEICRRHPEQARQVAEYHLHWRQLEDLKERFGFAGAVTQRLARRFGSQAPQVDLEASGTSAPHLTSRVLSRLARRGSTAGRYHLKGEIATGGMGAILRVWDEDLRRTLAMKVMLDREGSRDTDQTPEVDERNLARFLEEAQVTGQLDHPGIVPIHELGVDAEGRVYFTMKMVKGRDFKAILELVQSGAEGWTQVRALGVLLKVCEAMAYAHDKNVIHRDLKPPNVMVGRYGEVYVMDWGLAKILGGQDRRDIRVQPDRSASLSVVRSERHDEASGSPDSPLYTMDGDVVGTPAYMPPEQAAGRIEDMGPHSDVYAVGAMLYHLLAGGPPFVPAGARLNNYAIWYRVQEGPPTPLDQVAPAAPAELVAICEKAMAREIPDRYGDMASLAADLSAFLEGRVVRAYETGAWAEARKWASRNRSLAGALTAAGLLLVGGLAVSLTQKSRADAKATEAENNLTLAQENEAEARSQRDLARAEQAKVLRLSDVKRLQELRAEADELWPPYPAAIADMLGWIERAGGLVANLPVHRATLDEMRGLAVPRPEGGADERRAAHPVERRLEEARGEVDRLQARLEAGRAGSELAQVEARLAVLDGEVQWLTNEVAWRRDQRFGSSEQRWQYDVLLELILGLEDLQAGLLAEEATTAPHGWSLPRRVAFARRLEAGFAKGGEYEQAWSNARAAIDATYPEFELWPQQGLLPLGPDPDSGLWEFAHLMTGDPPSRDAEGRLVLEEGSGLVLVLLPGGSFWMGAQGLNDTRRNYDVDAGIFGDEGPVHEVLLSPFLVSKFEMTQGQWKRLTGRNPSSFGLDGRWENHWLASGVPASLLHPVEQVNWLDCRTWLHRAGLELPSEAQWEYAARGGTVTPWWTGSEKETLAGAANLVDSYATKKGGTQWPGNETWLDDGAVAHAPVGTYAANPFGLHEVTGNVSEWCLDGDWGGNFYVDSPELDPVAPWVEANERVHRGSSYTSTARIARSAARARLTPSHTDRSLGVRPMRALDP